jgi:hypothetical protein
MKCLKENKVNDTDKVYDNDEDEDEDKDENENNIIPNVCQINIWDSPTYKSKCNTNNLIEVVDLNGNPKWVCQEHIDNYKKMEK